MADFVKTLNELRQKKADKLKEANNLIGEGKFDEAKAINDELDGLVTQIATVEDLAARSKDAALPQEDPSNGAGGKPQDKETVRPFNSLGEQLQAIVNAAKTHTADERLIRVNNAVNGASEGVGADGGFAVQEDFAGAIMESCVERSELLSRLDTFTVGASSNAARWLMVDETDVSAAVFGGVQMFWASEGVTVGTSKPRFREMKMDLEKMMGFAYATDELLADAAFMTGFFGSAFQLAADRLLTAGVIAGDGVGKPMGILNSSALISVAKGTGQAAKTLTGENIIKMLGRAMPKDRQNLVWLMHPDLEEQLPYLTITQGTESKFLWNPEGGLGGFDSQRVLNKPVLFDDNCSAVGKKGDIMLLDPKQYMLLKKGTAKQDWSMHVEFLTDQMCFRLVFRCNGMPKVSVPITIKNSTQTRSPFVTLADRA